MPKELRSYAWRPGLNKELTQYAVEGTWYDGDKVRFRAGTPENIEGWQNAAASAGVTFRGIGRALFDWSALDSTKFLALGTHQKLYVWQDGLAYDITPIVSTVTVVSVQNTSVSSGQVILSVASGASVGDFVVFTSSATTVGEDIFLDGDYEVVSASAAAFTVSVTASANATSAAAGGSLTVNFLLKSGEQHNTFTTGGWGGGGWGGGTWGGGAGVTPINMRQWSLDAFGEDLIANPRGGAIYTWDKTGGTSQRATLVTAAPSLNNYVLVSPEDRHLVSFGSHAANGVFDPLLVRWSAAENKDDWVASIGNDAGDIRINGANQIVGALRSRGGILFWTDDSLHSMVFSGPPFTFDFQTLGVGCGLLAPHAAVEADGKVFWMSQDKFMVYDGAVRTLRCDVHHFVFDALEKGQSFKIHAGLNSEHNEVWWFYQTTSVTECDRYVVYDFAQDAWHLGSMARTTWLDARIFSNPLATGTDNKLYQHEVGVDADGSVLASYLESADFDLDDGQALMHIDKIVPDFMLDGTLQLTLKTKKYPGSGVQTTKGPFTVVSTTDKISMRARGRQAALRIASSQLGTKWKLGKLRLQLQPDGEQ